jgi:DNA-directed RNA polymerase specialized sigma24 family protein
MAWLLATCPDLKLPDAGRAVEALKKALQRSRQNGTCWAFLGMAHYRAGDWKAAVPALDKSMELGRGREGMESRIVFNVDSTGDDLFAVAEALSRLATAHPRAARLVQLRFFLGQTLEEAAALLGLQARTAYRDWAYARAWLRRELDRGT